MLDNVMFTALSTRQSHFNEGNEVVKFFPVEVSPFVALDNWSTEEIALFLDQLPTGRVVSTALAKRLSLPTDKVEVMVDIPLYQMVCNNFIPSHLEDERLLGATIRPLTYDDVPEMIKLTELTKPGPFLSRTIEFGGFVGLFVDGKLAAMCGNRLKVPGYTEVSGICTHPDYLGRGYASHLTSMVCEEVIKEGFIPFLHVKADNVRAIEVYKKLGFEVRDTSIYYYIFRKKNKMDG